MRRCIVVANREGEDNKTGDKLLFLTLARLPNKMSNGGLWYHKQEDLILNVCINKANKPNSYDLLHNVKPTSLVDIDFGVNDFTQKTFVSNVELCSSTSYSDEDLYK